MDQQTKEILENILAAQILILSKVTFLEKKLVPNSGESGNTSQAIKDIKKFSERLLQGLKNAVKES